MSDYTTEELLEIISHLSYQFGFRMEGGRLGTGGMSALEAAFDALGWDDPYQSPVEVLCEVVECGEFSAIGTHMGELYLRLCGEHGQPLLRDGSAISYGVKPHALEREATRDPVTRQRP